MKKLIYLTVAVLIGMTACNDDIEIWDSNNLSYSGTYVCDVSTLDADGEIADEDHGITFELYNTASDLPNELWIWNHNKGDIPLKSKLFLDGTSDNFKSKSTVFDELTNNLLQIDDIIPDDPIEAGTTEVVTSAYIRCSVEEGKILPDGMTTVGGNVADSIYIKMNLYGADVKFVSYLLPEEQRVNSKVEEFAWEVESVTYNETENETIIISGHRYTGFSEDE